MPATILSGNTVRDARFTSLMQKFTSISPTPELAIIQVGNRTDSTTYIGAKIAFANKVGVVAHHIHLPEDIHQQDLIHEIEKCNANRAIKGIIVQLPLPGHIDREFVINTIDSRKDIDGLTSINTELLTLGRPKAITPATARGVMELFSYYKIEIQGKKVTVIGRSQLVGKPLAQLCTNKGALVTVAHSGTINLVKETVGADIIITAVGKPGLIRAPHVRSGQIIIDVGGDVDFTAVCQVIGETGAITPIPGGVGPMTVLCLFENLADVSV